METAVLVRCSFAPARPRVGLRVLTRADLRTVMTSETVPVEQPGALVDELRIRDRAVETVYVERMPPGRKASDEG